MKKIIIITGTILVIAIGVVFFVQRAGVSKQETELKFDVLSRGDIKNTVASTGTLSAVGTVAVGSQISGTVDKMLVDYNDKVKKGQLLAVVDKTMLEASVRDAEASVAKSQAQLNQAQTDYQRNEKLFQEGYISELTLLSKKTEVETATAALQSAEAALKRAQTNLNYADIRSPITGTVIERSVDAGQTIAASMNAPTLFTIAEDLAHMQIEANVDETDIGQIKDGMAVQFTVQAYPEETFTGTVRQIRLQPTTVQDVVTYTVIVDAANEKGLLLPGMTATVEFLVEERLDVLLVPNTALNFKPSETLLAQLFQQSQGPVAPHQGNRPGRPPGDGTEQNAGMMGIMGPGPGQNPTGAPRSWVFYLDDVGNPQMAWLVTGATDGSLTEVVQSAQLHEGTRVITGVNTSSTKTDKKSALNLAIPGLGGPSAGGPPPGGPPPGGP
jgi:HlyD family secretion protein